MRLTVIVTMLVIGCGAGVEIGGECDRERACEDGAVCDFTDPGGGAVCIDADGDLDGDGLPNGSDFCAHAPGGEFDEDGDGIGDDCDACPIAPPTGDLDSDGDGLVSPCDPDPDAPGDQIVAFTGFARGLPEGFTASSGWTFENGEAIAMPGDPEVIERIAVNLPLITRNGAVLAEYRIDDTDPTATQNFAGVAAVDARPAGGSEIRCAGTRTGLVDRLVIDTELEVNGTTFVNLFDASERYRVVLQLEGADTGCAIVSGDEAGAAQARNLGEVSNQAGLVVRGAIARFPYLLVIQRTPPPQT